MRDMFWDSLDKNSWLRRLQAGTDEFFMQMIVSLTAATFSSS